MRARFFLLLPILVAITAASPLDTLAQRQVTVQGEGKVEVAPDQAVVRFAIATTNRDPEQARARNAEASAAAMNRVRGLGIEDRHLRLETLRLQPQRRYNPETRTYDEVGFEAVRELSVTVNDLDVLPQLIAEIVQAGANRLSGVDYQLSDRDKVTQDALRLAAENARLKAELLAETLGATVGFVMQIQEGGVFVPTPKFRMDVQEMAIARDASAPEPEAYASGQIEVTANVTVTFAIQ